MPDIKYFAVLVLASLTACGPAQNDPGPGGVTVGEAKALDEAAEMLDSRNAPIEGPGGATNTQSTDQPSEPAN